VQVWMATEPVDMRRGHDGLLALVRAPLCTRPPEPWLKPREV
jgi:hypothetical protein